MSTTAALIWRTIPYYDILAVYGYIHECCDPSLFIPDDLVHFIAAWYYDVTVWRIKDAELDRFLALRNGQAIYGKPFKMNGITFHCSLCPMGWKTNQNGFVQYYLEVKEMNPNIASFTVYFEFYCYETKSSWKGIRTLTKINDAVGWFHYTLPLVECQKMVSYYGVKQLTFGINVEVLNINYKLNVSHPNGDPTDECKSDSGALVHSRKEKQMEKILYTQTRHLTLDRLSEQTWVLNKYPLQRFKQCLYPKNFHSPTFDHYWCFECQANFEHNIMIYCRLKLIRMPYYIKSMRIRCQLQTNMKCESDKEENGLDMKQDHGKWEMVEFTFKHNYTKWKAYLTEQFKHENSIRINVKIEVLDLIDWNEQSVHQDQWYKYGVVNNNSYKPLMVVQYVDDIESHGRNQYLTHLEYANKQLTIKKVWIKPNFLNIPLPLTPPH